MSTSNNNANLNNLSKSKDRIDSTISNVEQRKSQVQTGLTVISPDTKIDGEIKELQIDKELATLRRESRKVEFEMQYSFNQITLEEHNERLLKLDIAYNEEIKLIEQKIEILRKQKENTNPYKNIERKKLKNKAKRQASLTNIRAGRSKAISGVGKFMVATATTALAMVLSKIIYSQMTSSNHKMAKLETMVEAVNTQIDTIKTVEDINRARIARNNAVIVLTDIENKLTRIKKLIDKINKIVTVIYKVIKIMNRLINLVPFPLKAPIKIALQKIENILGTIVVVLTIASGILGFLIDTVIELRNRLKQIGDLLDILYEDPTKLGDDFSKLLGQSNYGKLGLLEGDYKGWRFVIKEEFDARYVVQGFKRRFAEAINIDNTPVLKSEASFTLDADVLVEELKLIIDERDLKP